MSSWMCCEYYGLNLLLSDVEAAIGTTKDGTSETGIIEGMRWLGFKISRRKNGRLCDLKKAIKKGHPVIVNLDWDKEKKESEHYGVVFGYGKLSIDFSKMDDKEKKFFKQVVGIPQKDINSEVILLADPSIYEQVSTIVLKREFYSRWRRPMNLDPCLLWYNQHYTSSEIP